MPDSFDLAKLDNWFGLRPGMTQTEANARLQALGVAAKPYSDDNFAATIEEHDLEFYFTTDGSERLRQLSIDSGDITWSGRPLLEARLDDALRAFEPFGRAPMWQPNDVIGEAFPDATSTPTPPVSDERLLEEGTVWLPDRSLGLVVGDGEVLGVAWRDPRDLPATFAGPVTEAQRQLSKRPDLEDYLAEKRLERIHAETPKNPYAPLHAVLVVVCIGLFAFAGKHGFDEMRRWNQAVTLSGKFVSLERVPRKKHFELGPEEIRRHMPDDPTHLKEVYRIQYLDPAGQRQIADLAGGEFYVPPREIGEGVEVAYVDGNPPRVSGPSRARDMAFIETMPWMMAVGVFYIVGLAIIGLLPRLVPLIGKAIVAKTSVADPSRPELR